MSLKFLPEDIENLILDYKEKFENFENFQTELKLVFAHRRSNVEYTWGLNDTTYELWCFHNSKYKDNVEVISTLEEFPSGKVCYEITDIIDHNRD